MNKLWFFIFVLLLPASLYAQNKIIVETIGGSESGASVERGGKKIPLHTGDTLETGDRIETGTDTAIDIRLTDLSLVRIGVNSSFRLEKDSQGFFDRLLKGIVRVLVPEKKTSSNSTAIRYRILTPTGTIGVRGTEFVVEHADKITRVHGLKGEVLFGGANLDFSDSKKYILVGKGFESQISGELASPLKAFEPKEYIKEINAGAFAPLAKTPFDSSKEATLSDQESIISQRIITAAAQGDVGQLRSSFAAGEDIKAVKFENENTVLHVAAVHDKLEAIQYLLDAVKIPVDALNKFNQTALMLAAHESENKDTLQLLLENGADYTRKDKSGRTVLDFARINLGKNKKEVLDFLKTWISQHKK